MRRIFRYLGIGVAFSVVGLVSWAAIRVRVSSVPAGGALRSSWSAAAAANYLDKREVWWQGWPVSQRSQGTVCISCHTVLPYALARPMLRRQLGETGLTANEERMLASIEKRVTDWQGIDHYYSDPAHYGPSRATESVLNAVILSEYDSDSNYFSPVTRQAFDEAWALQLTSGPNAGGWEWQNFHEAPWESSESAYQGAAMVAVALGLTPKQYSGEPEVQDHILHLREYLLSHYSAQPTLNQLYVMWASARLPGLVTDAQRTDLIHQLTALQNPDGGWSLSLLDRQHSLKDLALDLFKRVEGFNDSDGCATGLVVLALEENGVSRMDPVLQRGLAWLYEHQYEDGSWWASSMNGFRNPRSYMGRFMSDAATGYATLAIERSLSLQSVPSGATASGADIFRPPSGRSPLSAFGATH
jgi:squalene-hopene/tetraprenyl-beta-curcumene cyclase